MRLLPVLLAASLSAACLADDANWSVVGGAGNFSKNKQIRMEKENVQIHLGRGDMRVHATFWFKNEGPKTDVTMAFPDDTTSNGRKVAGGLYSAIMSFRSTVDGKPVKVWRETVQKPKGGDDIEYRSVWLKKVPFAANQTRVVTVDYTAEQGIAGNGWMFNTYVLETGATWKGTIGECIMTVDWSGSQGRSAPRLVFEGEKRDHPATWRWLGPTKATTTLRNIEPDFNLNLTTIAGFWNFRLNGKPMSQGLGLANNYDDRLLKGPHSDLLIPISKLGDFFGSSDGEAHEWANPIARSFGGKLTLIDRRRVRLGNGKTVTLARPATGPVPGSSRFEDEETFIRLKDLVRALGGTYTYVASRDRVDINFPPTAKR